MKHRLLRIKKDIGNKDLRRGQLVIFIKENWTTYTVQKQSGARVTVKKKDAEGVK